MILILVVGTGIIATLTTYNMLDSSNRLLENAISEYDLTQARLNAESSFELAIKHLLLDTNFTNRPTIPLKRGSGSFSIITTNSRLPDGPSAGLTSVRQINATGRVNNKVVNVKSTIQLQMGTTGPIMVAPPFMRYGIISDQTITMNGNITISDDNNPLINANVHTNSNFQMNGNNTIKGFLTYVGTAHSNPSGRLNTSFIPNVNPTNIPVHRRVEPINIPSFNPDAFLSRATQIHTGNLSLSGNRTLGTKDIPQIIYVGGDLTISGNITGYAAFIVKGNININGNVTITSPDLTGNNLGLYTMQNVNVNGNVTLRAQVFANQNVNLGGNSRVYGGITAKGTINFNGNVSIYYREPTPQLTQPFWPQTGVSTPPKRPKLLAYFE
ncbi:MAG: hypothetical protein N2043_06555 [Ignavibacterium sp.]|nr:hypothetical protein [Ignavibacterium sp.]